MSAVGLPRFWNYYLSTSVPALRICYTLRLPALNGPRLQVLFIIRICYSAFRMVESQLAFCARIGNERGPSTIPDKPSSSIFIALRL